MHTVQRFFGLAAVLALLGIISICASASPSQAAHRGFIANGGQWPAHVLFASRQAGADIWITRTGLVVDEYTVSGDRRTGRVYTQELANATPQGPGSIEPGLPAGTVSFFRGTASSWVSVPSYKSLVLRDVAPGVSMAYSIDAYGRVVRETLADGKVSVSTLTEIRRSGKGDDIQASTPSPSTVFGAYLSAADEDQVAGVRTMANGDVVIAGSTSAMTFPGTIGGYVKDIKGMLEGYVLRCDPTLS
ncbi:MAG: hypothetical protein FGM24_10660, partial [Candidatus Kapabacteria bacterium]|nr:hypothetical protein [Candidatus Kapabacteria bacterium]